MRKRLQKKIFKKRYAILKARLEASPAKGQKDQEAVLKEMASSFGVDEKILLKWKGKTPEEIFGEDLLEQ
ncbi:MAG: hypothetical protein H8E32_03370 [Nitrospinae bacterium]|nr:hypothetical protein [Nitrospinota bacterium]